MPLLKAAAAKTIDLFQALWDLELIARIFPVSLAADPLQPLNNIARTTCLVLRRFTMWTTDMESHGRMREPMYVQALDLLHGCCSFKLCRSDLWCVVIGFRVVLRIHSEAGLCLVLARAPSFGPGLGFHDRRCEVLSA